MAPPVLPRQPNRDCPSARRLPAVTRYSRALPEVRRIGASQKFGIHALSDGMLWKELAEYTMQACYASDDAIQNHRETLVRVLAAYGKAYRFVSTPASRTAYLDAWRKVTGQADPKQGLTHWNWLQEYHPYDVDLVLSDEQINYVQQSNVQFGAQKQVLPIAQVADMSLAREALKLLG